jgi:hypothetical protein
MPMAAKTLIPATLLLINRLKLSDPKRAKMLKS